MVSSLDPNAILFAINVASVKYASLSESGRRDLVAERRLMAVIGNLDFLSYYFRY